MARDTQYAREIRKVMRSCNLPDGLDLRQAIYEIADALNMGFVMSAWLRLNFGIDSPFAIESDEDLIEAWHFTRAIATLVEQSEHKNQSSAKVVELDAWFAKSREPE